MVRRTLVLLSLAAAALAAGCGGSDRAPTAAEAPPAAVAATGTVEPTDGRLGDATTVRPDGSRAVAPGGAVDLTDRDAAPERDGVGAGAACAGADVAPTTQSLGVVAEATLCLLNGERADRGLAPLAANGKLASAASAYAADLVAGSYFSHTGRDGSDVTDRIRDAGYIPDDRPWRIGENLAWGTGALATPAAIVQAWMNSPGHRDNILNAAYREIGVGVVVGNPKAANGLGGTYVTEFGVIEGAQAVAGAYKSKAKKARRAARKRAAARKARASRRAGKPRVVRGGRGKAKHRRVKGRGPVARIAV